MKYGFGVDLGGTTVKLAFFEESGKMLEKWEIPTNRENNGANILPDIAGAINGYLADKKIGKDQILGIGIGIPGAVYGAGLVDKCDNLGWRNVDVQTTLSQATGLPVCVGNDANVAALGEAWVGGGQGCENMVLVTLGTGVGGGIIIGGRQVSGVHGAGGEIGHMVLCPEETAVCGCGKRGCVEQYCSATGIVRLAKERLVKTDDNSILRKENLTCKAVFDCAAAGDEMAQAVLEQVYDYMGRFLANICCVADPEIIVLGGGVSRAGEPLLMGAQKAFQKYAYHACRSTRFALAALGNDAGAWGCFKLVLDNFG